MHRTNSLYCLMFDFIILRNNSLFIYFAKLKPGQNMPVKLFPAHSIAIKAAGDNAILEKHDLIAIACSIQIMCDHQDRDTILFIQRFSKHSITAVVDFESKLPVGSSARITLGSLIIALQIAALCCSPPDTSCG